MWQKVKCPCFFPLKGWRGSKLGKIWSTWLLNADFVRSYFNKNEALGSWTLFSSKLDFPGIKTLETHALNVKKCVTNVLISGESNFDEKCVQPQSFICEEVSFYKIHTLTINPEIKSDILSNFCSLLRNPELLHKQQLK